MSQISVRKSLLNEPGCRTLQKTAPTTVTLWDLFNTVIDEAGNYNAQLVNVVIADLMQSGKVKWTGEFTSIIPTC